jgi:tRNA (guanine6-N2)-methyltransferase
MKRTRLTYLAQTQPGFEAIAADEIAQTLEGAILRGTRTVADKNGMLLFDYNGDAGDLMALRTIEDLFVVLATLPDLPPTRDALRTLEQAANRATTVEPALTLARQIQPGSGGRGKLRFRVISRQVGTTAYRRVDAQNAIERGIATRGDHRWQLADDRAIEFWLTLLPNPPAGRNQSEVILALRLSDERMRHREYKLEHMPASLRPTAAAALAWLTQPADDDVFLDPMCGAGTMRAICRLMRDQSARWRSTCRLASRSVLPRRIARSTRRFCARSRACCAPEGDWLRSLPMGAAWANRYGARIISCAVRYTRCWYWAKRPGCTWLRK